MCDYSAAIATARESMWKDLTHILDQIDRKEIEAYLDKRKGKELER